MINFFTPAANDASLTYLANIFGNVNGVIPSGSTVTLLGTMFKTFNSTVLAVAALIVVYMTVVGVMMTAHEGEFMKKWNSLWTPIRAVIGIAALIPTSSGFSGLQIIMMWVIVQGIGAADTLWNTVLSFVSTTGSPFAQISVTNAGVTTSLEDLFKGLTCDESARASHPPPYVTTPQTGQYYCNGSNSWCGTSNNIDASATSVNTFSMGPNSSCGTMQYCNQDAACNGSTADTESSSLGCQTCKAQVAALQSIITTLRGTADILINADYNYQNYYTNGYSAPGKPNSSAPQPDWLQAYCTSQSIAPDQCRGPVVDPTTMKLSPGGLPDPSAGSGTASNEVVSNVYWPYAVKPAIGNDNFINTSVSYYMNAINTALGTYLESQAQNTSPLSGQFSNAQNTGWLYAGAYYYTVAQVNKNNIQNTLPPLTLNVTDPQTGTANNPNTLQSYRNNFAAATQLISNANGSTSSPSSQTTAVMSDGANAIGTMMLNSTGGSGTNPLVQLAAAGYGLLLAAQVVFVVFMAVSLDLGLVSGVNGFVVGTGFFDPLAVATPVVQMIVVPILAALLGVMVTMGATLGVYVPLIPYIIFTLGAIGWFTSTIETMIAGPLVAVGILAPGGHHEILGKAEPAVMLLFNVFLRPSLMIFGLIAAMLLASVVVTMINAMFFNVMLQVVGTGTSSLDVNNPTASIGTSAASAANPLELIFFLIAYVLLIVAALNKCFAAIHIIPERVMRWMQGGQGEQYGEAEGLSETKRGVESGAASVGGGMRQGGQTVQEVGKAKGDMDERKKRAKPPDITPE